MSHDKTASYESARAAIRAEHASCPECRPTQPGVEVAHFCDAKHRALRELNKTTDFGRKEVAS